MAIAAKRSLKASQPFVLMLILALIRMVVPREYEVREDRCGLHARILQSILGGAVMLSYESCGRKGHQQGNI